MKNMDDEDENEETPEEEADRLYNEIEDFLNQNIRENDASKKHKE